MVFIGHKSRSQALVRKVINGDNSSHAATMCFSSANHQLSQFTFDRSAGFRNFSIDINAGGAIVAGFAAAFSYTQQIVRTILPDRFFGEKKALDAKEDRFLAVVNDFKACKGIIKSGRRVICIITRGFKSGYPCWANSRERAQKL